ncbi:MAG: AAA family ATPase [Candidatus Paceibacterota bacterium]|jgi:predicted ATP-dependent endonuclease of OLD family
MIKKIEIKKGYRTIPDNFNLELEKMTVITGVNNSGKTNFIKILAGEAKIKKELKKADFFNEKGESVIPEIVYIAAENIQPNEDEAKFSSKTTGLIKNLSKLFLNLERKFILKEQNEIIGDIKNLIKKASKNLEDFNGKNEHALEIEFNEEELDPSIIIQALIKNISGLENEIPRELDELGQGTQRLIVASVLKAYMDILIEKNIVVEKQIIILFEEPEIYLHPSLKKTLNMTLKAIADLPNHQVIITTHDPYFAYTNLNDDSVIYSFKKDKNGNTKPPEKPNVIFGIEDELLHIHLFNKVLEKASLGVYPAMSPGSLLDKYLEPHCGREKRHSSYYNGDLTLPLYIRHLIHHPSATEVLSQEDLKKSIEILSSLIK